MAMTTGTPASVRWGLMLMGALLLSQVVGLHRVGPAAGSSALQAATITSQPSPAPDSTGVARRTPRTCGSGGSRDSLEHETALEIASSASACGAKPACPTPTRRSC